MLGYIKHVTSTETNSVLVVFYRFMSHEHRASDKSLSKKRKEHGMFIIV